MRLLDTFQHLFEGTKYLHRKSNLGDLVAVQFYEDLLAVSKSAKLPPRIAAHDRVINLKNITAGKTARRGDGTLGELVPSAVAIVEKNFVVARGPTANIEIGVESKILAKAMIKQIDRVIGDLQRQVTMLRNMVEIRYASVLSESTGRIRTLRTKGADGFQPTARSISVRFKNRRMTKPGCDKMHRRFLTNSSFLTSPL